MGQSHSTPEPADVPIEQLSHELALKFADKCFSHLEIAHFKDNFKNLADHKDDIEYWKEETLCRFLSLPEAIHAGPVVYQIATYLGSFPFPSLAPAILTREATLKVVTLLTNRYKKVLKRGEQDKKKLLYRSMAIFDRRMSAVSSASPVLDRSSASVEPHSDTHGFNVDAPANDEEEEDDDDFVLAALDSLDAIEVFKEDQKKERKINKAHIPADNFEKLVTLLLLFAPLTPQDNVASLSDSLSTEKLRDLSSAAKAIVAAFNGDVKDGSIRYAPFMTTGINMPHLFRPLNALFEHLLFSKYIDLSKHTGPPIAHVSGLGEERISVIHQVPGRSKPDILNEVVLAQLSISLEVGPASTSGSSSFFHSLTRFDEIYSTASDGTSLSSFSRQVLSWKAPTLFLLRGTSSDSDEPIMLGAYLPEPWKENTTDRPEPDTALNTVLFQLRPQHAIFRANKYNKSAPFSYISSKSGIALGCIIPAQSRLQAQHQKPILGPVSLLVDDDLSTAVFQHDGEAGQGVFMTDPRLEEAQKTGMNRGLGIEAKKRTIDIDAIEVWGVSVTGSADAMESQRKRLAFEEAEAERRRGVNFGGDKDGARHLLEMAGLVGQNQSGGSV